jgi:5'-phosphate synthase pdxT subunit
LSGGESTTLNIFFRQPEFFEKLKSWLKTDPVVWGTCAGMILLSNKIQHQKEGGQLKVDPLNNQSFYFFR